MSQQLKLLSDVASIATQILTNIHTDDETSAPLAANHDVLALTLSSANDWVLSVHAELHNRPLTSAASQRLESLFESTAIEWHTQIIKRAAVLEQKLSACNSRPLGQTDLLCEVLQNTYQRGLDRLRCALLKLVDDSIRTYQADLGMVENASIEDAESGRGHSQKALAILERAFSYATNISQAEKRRLAELTGLEPRQVVIWFQNRRNRKIKTQRRAITIDGVPWTPPEPLPGGRPSTPGEGSGTKRKRTLNELEAPRRPSSPPPALKKLRATAMDTPPPQIDRRLYSSSSSSSMSSSVDSISDSLFAWQDPWRTPSNGSVETSTSSPLSCNSKDSPVKDLPPQSEGQNAPHPILLAPSGEAYVFQDDSNIPQLDFDDLQLDPAVLDENLRLSFDGLTKLTSIPSEVGVTPSVGWNRTDATDRTPDAVQAISTSDGGQSSTQGRGDSTETTLNSTLDLEALLADLDSSDTTATIPPFDLSTWLQEQVSELSSRPCGAGSTVHDFIDVSRGVSDIDGTQNDSEKHQTSQLPETAFDLNFSSRRLGLVPAFEAVEDSYDRAEADCCFDADEADDDGESEGDRDNGDQADGDDGETNNSLEAGEWQPFAGFALPSTPRLQVF